MKYNALLVGTRIRAYRKQLGLTQEELAERVDISPPYLGQIENGRRGVNLSNLIALANALNVTLDDLTTDLTARQSSELGSAEVQWLALLDKRSPQERQLLLNLVRGMCETLFPQEGDSI